MPARFLPGLYDLLLSSSQGEEIERINQGKEFTASTEILRVVDASRYLTHHIGGLLYSAFESVGTQDKGLIKQIGLANRVIDVIAEHIKDFSPDDYASNEILKSLIENQSVLKGGSSTPLSPDIPLGVSDLLVNDTRQSAIGHQLQTEIPSADRIDIIISFLKRSGFAMLKSILADRIQSGTVVRVLTTTYMGATESAVIDALQKIGAEVRISYGERTRLHAKAWLFHRDSGYSTAFIGSSNLSHSAQTLGLEWNVRLSAVETPHILEKFAAAFDGYWNAEDFEPYDASKFEQATKRYQQSSSRQPIFFDLRPFPFQEEILEQLKVARDVLGRKKNLVVAATGTGKTVIAALDYRNLTLSKRDDAKYSYPSLLFIAHRQEILEQAQATFRTALRDGSFGEDFYAGKRPSKGVHVFASIQSLSKLDLATISPSDFDVVIVDEFHHAEAPTYKRLLEHLKPQYLLGLTATPERSDGFNIQSFFDGQATAELRLWDAIDRGLLVPFQYFGLHDNVDLSNVKWHSGRYDIKALEDVYLQNLRRVDLVVQNLADQLVDTRRMRALGFCVSVSHARFMAESFNQLGISAIALTGKDSGDARRDGIEQLAKREINVIFTVDIFNEGVDIPEIDTVLFLRPTESATLFLQQLGRGLRLHDSKDCLTVLDFIGRARREFRFDQRYKSLTGQSRRRLQQEIERGFPHLPPGCSIQLDRQSRELILESVRTSLQLTKSGLIAELRGYDQAISLGGFVKESGIELEEVYRGFRTWSELRRSIEGWDVPEPGPHEAMLERALGRMLHIDDPERLDLYEKLLSGHTTSFSMESREGRIVGMLLVSLFGPDAIVDLNASLALLDQHPAIVDELRELIPVLRDRIRHIPIIYTASHPIPLKVHCRYSRDEIMAAFDARNRSGALFQPREGVYYHSTSKSNLLFVTLNKSEQDYSPTTMYRDYALSPNQFHWQSQSTTRPDSERGRRHIQHLSEGITPLLFVRESKKDEYQHAKPYIFLGPVNLERHHGERPMNVVWKMEYEIPGDILRIARVA